MSILVASKNTPANSNSVVNQGIRYLLVGFSSAAIELMLFLVLHEGLEFSTLLANPLALTAATLYNFVLSRKWTFKSVSRLRRTAILYALLFCFNQLFSTFTIMLLEDWDIYSLLAKVFTMGCIVTWNFVLYRKVIFK